MRSTTAIIAALSCVSLLPAVKSESRQKSRPSISVSPRQWTLIGPQPTIHPVFQFTSGRVTGLAIDPRDANVVYAATGGGGVWKPPTAAQPGRPSLTLSRHW